ncbi:hypothetical protein C8R43DRAFT_1043672 [Mycena crocata]|nr:hypothetical protein C8R43DRAFT_1043672 [Mycena crocata]
MTHISAAEKRKKRREKKLLEEEQLRVSEERARQTPVSTPIPSSSSSTPRPVSSAAATDAETVHVINDGFDAGVRAFPPGHPATHYPPWMQEFIYGPVSRSPSPAPTCLHPSPATHDPSWYRDDDVIPAILTVHACPVSTPRDFSALRGESVHPWRTIRRRNQRLLPQRRPFPRSFPKRISPQESPPPIPSAPIHVLITGQDPNDPVPILALPRPIPMPGDAYSILPFTAEPPSRPLPAETAYGTVHSLLALACAEQFPWLYVSLGHIAEIAWGPLSGPDVREHDLMLLPADQLVFVSALTEMIHLEPDLGIFFERGITDLANAWVDHCDSFG